MATRIETQLRREKLRQFLREAALKGTLAVGEMVPPVRELATRFELSVPVALEVVKGLVEEGVLTTVPSVGTFVGHPTVAQPDVYMLVNTYDSSEQWGSLRIGFEDRISQLGGASVILDEKSAQDYFTEGVHPNVAGVFRTHSPKTAADWEIPEVWKVEFGHVNSDKPRTDMVYFDNVDGGAQATRHLQQLGHSHIAFLSLQGQPSDSNDFICSSERGQGWKVTMEARGHHTEGLLFQTSQTSDFNPDSKSESSRQTAESLIARSDITGVVVANSFTARVFFETLENSKIEQEDWPAIVTFDSDPVLNGYQVSSLRLPWGEIGRTGAELLWQRRQQQIFGPPQQRLVPMRLVSRLSCRPNWARDLGFNFNRVLALA